MPPLSTHIILFFFFVFSIPMGFSQQTSKGLAPNKNLSEYNINSWTSKDGLPTNGAKAIVQTKDGYLWIGTFDGLVRFDGIKMKVFGKQNNPVFMNNTFTKFFKEDSSLWIGSHSGGLIHLNIYTNEWNVFSKNDGLPSNIVQSIFRDSKGTLWIGTTSGLSFFDEKTKTFSSENIPNSIQDITIYDIIEDDKNRLWLSTNSKGIFHYNIITKEFRFFVSLGRKSSLSLCKDANGNIWVASDNGLYRFDKNETKTYFCTDDGLINNNISKVYADKRGAIWIGSDEGLSRYYKGKFSSIRVLGDDRLNSITDITEDSEGSLWATTYRSGLYRIKDGKFLNLSDGFTGKVIHGIYQDVDSTFLIATSFGLNVIKDGKISPYPYKIKPKNELIRDVYRDTKNRLWIATGGGLYLEKPNGEAKEFLIKDGLANIHTRVILEDNKGNMWFGTRSGLNRLTDGKLISYSKKDGLSNGFILSLFQDSKGYIWIGTVEGLNRYKDGVFENFYTKDGLTGDVIFQIHEDKKGTLWIGANGGLNRYKNGEFFGYTTQDGLKASSVFQVIEDETETFWLTYSSGVYTVKKEELNQLAAGKITKVSYKNYDKTDGMRNSNCTANAKAIITQNGNIWFPTYGGISIINPKDVTTNYFNPPVIIEKISVDNIEQKKKNNVIIIPAEKRRITIKYTGISLLAASKLKFKYMLEGFDKQWQEASETEREISYTNLPTGEFKFRIKVANSDGIWSEKEAAIILKKEAYIYQTPIFQLFLVFFIMLFFLLTYQWRVNRIATKNKKLEIRLNMLIAERTYELKDKNETLIVLNEEKNNLINIVAHDLKNPLSQVEGLVNLLMLETQNATSEQSELLSKVFTVIGRLNKMIVKILDVDAIESGKANINFEKINITERLSVVVEGFENAAINKNIKLSFQKEQKPIFINLDPDYNYQVFENLISNAIKFSPPHTEVSIRLKNGNNKSARIEVKDQGKGISPEDMPKLFGKFQKLSTRPTAGEHSVGLGLSIVKKYVEAMEGKVWCESVPNRGATFIVEYPIAHNS